MKVNVRLPMGYGRAYNGSKGFVKASPTFDIEAFDDAGNKIMDPYPSKVKFGPEMYQLLKKILPGIAASHNEDLHYNGDVEVQRQGRLKQPQKYAYYGIGKNPLGLSAMVILRHLQKNQVHLCQAFCIQC